MRRRSGWEKLAEKARAVSPSEGRAGGLSLQQEGVRWEPLP